MSKSGIKIIEDVPGDGAPIQKGDRIRLLYDVGLNRGEILFQNQEAVWTVGDRNFVAGFRYGIEDMRVGGTRKFKASPHLCYRDKEVAHIPKNAVLVIAIKKLEFVKEKDAEEKNRA